MVRGVGYGDVANAVWEAREEASALLRWTGGQEDGTNERRWLNLTQLAKNVGETIEPVVTVAGSRREA